MLQLVPLNANEITARNTVWRHAFTFIDIVKVKVCSENSFNFAGEDLPKEQPSSTMVTLDYSLWLGENLWQYSGRQGYINRGTCSQPELTSCHVLPSAYVIIFWAVATNAVNKSVWRKKTVLDFPSTNMQWIMNNLWDTEHGSLRTRAQCSVTQSTVLWEPEHTGAPCSPRAPSPAGRLERFMQPRLLVWW